MDIADTFSLTLSLQPLLDTRKDTLSFPPPSNVDPRAPREAYSRRPSTDARPTHNGCRLPRSDGPGNYDEWVLPDDGPVIRVEKEGLRAGVYGMLDARIRRVSG
jgi:hypothetical protein